jgi:WD40 repeat protein
VAAFGAVAILIGVVVGAGLLQLRGGGQPAASGSLSTALATPATPVTPAGTGVVARLAIGQYGTYAWSPDGAHLLVSDESGSRVYDRFGKLVSSFGPVEGWLDAGHLIGGDGYVADIDASHTGGPTSNSRVVANGHGSAAIIVAVPACTGDPVIDWYKNGQYVKAGEKVTPYGWSPDGKLVLLGHLDCSSQDAEMNGWKGPVDIVDFETRRVLATAPAVRGLMAFNPSATRLAAESDGNLEIVDIATGKVHTVPHARLLGWSDDDYVYCLTAAGSVARIGATAETPAFTGIVVAWPIVSSIDLQLVVDPHGTASRIMAADGKATVLDLAPENLGPVRDLGEATSTPQPRLSALWRSPWSPEGRMIALKSSDGTSLVLISVDPALIRPGVGP